MLETNLCWSPSGIQDGPLDLSRTAALGGGRPAEEANQRPLPRYTIDMEELVRTYMLIASQPAGPLPAHLTSSTTSHLSLPLAHLTSLPSNLTFSPSHYTFPASHLSSTPTHLTSPTSHLSSSSSSPHLTSSTSHLSTSLSHLSFSPPSHVSLASSYPAYLPFHHTPPPQSSSFLTSSPPATKVATDRRRQRRGSEDTWSEDSEMVSARPAETKEKEASKAKQRRRRNKERRLKASQERRKESLANACNCRFCYEDHILKLRQKAVWGL